MKLSTFAIAAMLAAIATAASAADLSPKMVTKAAPIPPVATWTGFYVGGQIGWGHAETETGPFFSTVGPFVAGVSGGTFSGDGIAGGGHVGANYQFPNNVVVGIEADINGTNADHSGSFLALGIPPGLPFTESNSIDYYGTVRARLGIASGQWLVYGTGGWAWARMNSTITSPGQFSGPFTTSNTQTLDGWVAGVGINYMYTPNWIIGVEYKHLDFGSATYTYVFPLAPVTASNTLTIDEVTVRASYKF